MGYCNWIKAISNKQGETMGFRNKNGDGARLGDVTLVHGCMICKEEVILMANRDSSKPLPPKGSILPEVCDKCREQYLKDGILIINPDSGDLIVIKETAFKKIFKDVDKVLKLRICLAEQGIIDYLRGEHERLNN